MQVDTLLRYTTRIMANHPTSEPLASAPPAAAAPPPLAAESTGVADASHHAPWPDPTALARDVTARLHPLSDHAVQRAIAPLAETIAQQTATIERLVTALHALHAALPPPAAREITPDTPAQHPHAFAAYQDAQKDIADQENVREDIVDRESGQDRRVADRRTHDAGGSGSRRTAAWLIAMPNRIGTASRTPSWPSMSLHPRSRPPTPAA